MAASRARRMWRSNTRLVWQHYQTGHFLSTVYLLDVDGKKERVIPRDVQVDPVRDFPSM